jgi:hypothetical protein
MHDMSGLKRAQRHGDGDEATYSASFGSRAVAFHPAGRILAEIAELAPTIGARANDIEGERRIPPDLIGALRSLGVFRMFAPQRSVRGGGHDWAGRASLPPMWTGDGKVENAAYWIVGTCGRCAEGA